MIPSRIAAASAAACSVLSSSSRVNSTSVSSSSDELDDDEEEDDVSFLEADLFRFPFRSDLGVPEVEASAEGGSSLKSIKYGSGMALKSNAHLCLG